MELKPVTLQRKSTNIYEQLVDTLQKLFGKHTAYRPVNAKGLVCEGTFTPAVTARTLSCAPHLQGKSVTITVRFSDFTGIATSRTEIWNASPRGIGIGFHLANGAATDIVAHSYNGFPVATAEEFPALVRALAASGLDASKTVPDGDFPCQPPASQAVCRRSEIGLCEFRERILLWR